METRRDVQVGPAEPVYMAYVMTLPGEPSNPWSSREKVSDVAFAETTVQFRQS